MNFLILLPLVISTQTSELPLPCKYWANSNARCVSLLRTNDVLVLVKPTGRRSESRGDYRYNIDEFTVVDNGGTLTASSVSVLTRAIPVWHKPGEWHVPAGLDASRTYLLVARGPRNGSLRFSEPGMSWDDNFIVGECPADSSAELAGAALVPTSLKTLKANSEFGARVMWNIADGLASKDELVSTSSSRFFHGIVGGPSYAANHVEGQTLHAWMRNALVPFARKAALNASPRSRFWIHGVVAEWTVGSDHDSDSRLFLNALEEVIAAGGPLDITEQLLLGRGHHAINIDQAGRIASKTDSVPLRSALLGNCMEPTSEAQLQRYLTFLDDSDETVRDSVMGHLAGWANRSALGISSKVFPGVAEENQRRRDYIVPRLKKMHLNDIKKGLPSLIQADLDRYAKGK